MPARTRPPSPESRFYHAADLAKLFDVCERTIWTWTAIGQLPKPIRKSRKWTAWPKEQIDELLRKWGGTGPPKRVG